MLVSFIYRNIVCVPPVDPTANLAKKSINQHNSSEIYEVFLPFLRITQHSILVALLAILSYMFEWVLGKTKLFK